jgi:hypothetical protein
VRRRWHERLPKIKAIPCRRRAKTALPTVRQIAHTFVHICIQVAALQPKSFYFQALAKGGWLCKLPDIEQSECFSFA